MRLNVWKSMRLAFVSAICLTLSVGMTFAAATDSGQIASGQKAKVKGVIVSRSGDLVKIQKKTGLPFIVAYTYTGLPMVMLAREMVRGGDIGPPC